MIAGPDAVVDEPIFLVGAERSGSTLLRLMLDHHEQIAFHLESEYVIDQLREGAPWPPLNTFYEYLVLQRTFVESNFRIDRSLSYPDLVRSFLEQRRQRVNKPIVGATVHRNFDQLPRIWPDARYLHLVRDGRDVAASAVRIGWASNAWVGVERWIDAERKWDRLRPHLSSDQWLDVRYEDLIQDARGALKRICEFIAGPFDESMFDYARTSTYDLPDPKLIYRWRTNLPDLEVQLIEARVGDMLVERGYSLSGLPRIEVTPWMRWKLRWQSRLMGARFRVKRYGWWLFLQQVLARRLGVTRWYKRVLLWTNAITTQYLK